MIWISPISLVVSICAGIAAYLIGMVNAFSTMKTAGAADPSELAGDISIALIGSLVAVPFALASLIVFIVAVIKHRKFSNPTLAG